MELQKIELRLVREDVGTYKMGKSSATSPRTTSSILNQVFDMENLTKEIFVVVFLNNKNEIVGLSKMSEGVINATLVSPRDIFQLAFTVNANSIIIAHNHPSGDTSPSNEDLMLTKRIKKASDIMDVNLIDHIIIGDNRYFSLKESGHIA